MDKSEQTAPETASVSDRDLMLQMLENAGNDGLQAVATPDDPQSEPKEQEDRSPAPEAEPEPVKAEEAKQPAEADKKSRQEKSEERATKTWEEINAEKAKLQEERERLEAERASAEEYRQKALNDIQTAKERQKHSPEDLERVAKEFENEGREDLAQAALARAEEIRKADAEAEQERQNMQFQTEWQTNAKLLAKEHPDLGDPKSELSKTVSHILEQRPVLKQYSNGIVDAVEVATTYLKGKEVDALKQQVADLQSELDEKSKLIQPGEEQADIKQPSDGSKAFEDMDATEMRNHLRKQFASADVMVNA